MSQETSRIASALEKIADEGININIIFPTDANKFVTDLPAMRIASALGEIADAINDGIGVVIEK